MFKLTPIRQFTPPSIIATAMPPDPMLPLTASETLGDVSLLIVSQSERLAALPEEAVWLANFVSPRTQRTYQAAVQGFIAFHGLRSSDELRTIGQSHLIAWREYLIQSGASPRTVRNRLAAVSSLFRHLCERQVAARNPVTGVQRPRVNASRVEAAVLTPEQVRRLLHAPSEDTLQGIRDRAILHVLFYTGCRVSEVTHLKVQDFFEDAGYWVLDFIVKGGSAPSLGHPSRTAIGVADLSGAERSRRRTGVAAVSGSATARVAKAADQPAGEQAVSPLCAGSRIAGGRYPAQRPRHLHHRSVGSQVPDRSGAGVRRAPAYRHHQDVRQTHAALPGKREFRCAVLDAPSSAASHTKLWAEAVEKHRSAEFQHVAVAQEEASSGTVPSGAAYHRQTGFEHLFHRFLARAMITGQLGDSVLVQGRNDLIA